MVTADDGTLQEVAQVIGREVRDTDLLGHSDKGTLALVLLDADFEHSDARHRPPRLPHRQLRIPDRAAHCRRRGLLSDARRRCRVAQTPGHDAPDRELARRQPRPATRTVPPIRRTEESHTCHNTSSHSARPPSLLRLALGAHRRRRRLAAQCRAAAARRAQPPPTTPGHRADKAGRRRRRSPDDYRLQAGRQAAHRGLQGRAALAVGADPARRQDHAAAGRRHRSDGPHADRSARRVTTALKDYVNNPVVTVIVVEGTAADRLRRRRGEPSGPGDAAGRHDGAAGAGASPAA